LNSCCVFQDHYDDERDKTVFHNTISGLQGQDQVRFVWYQTGLVLRPTVSDHITSADENKVRRTCICRRRSGGMEPVAVLRSQFSVLGQFQDGAEDISVNMYLCLSSYILMNCCMHCMSGCVRRPWIGYRVMAP